MDLRRPCCYGGAVRDRRLNDLPAIHVLAAQAEQLAKFSTPRWAVVEAARRMVANRREAILARADAAPDAATIDAAEVAALANALVRPRLRRVINATGVILHTNLGRAPLAVEARLAIDHAARGFTNLEYDLERGQRGSRHDHLRDLLRELTGAEDALVANNNAAATVLGLAALAAGKDVVVSRGELIEIGGSFRLPEILALSRGNLVEVGTTNKTHARDYDQAIGPTTGLLLKVHRSNFAVVGFTAEVSAQALVAIGRARGIPTMIDLGSGMLVDRDVQRHWGLPEEPTVREAVGSGADLVTFSGDKLLGGPQAGIAVGKASAIEAARKHPLMRALRPDKLSLAGLEATLRLYRDDRSERVPVVAMISRDINTLFGRATALAKLIESPELTVKVEPSVGTVGGGAMPLAELPSVSVTLAGTSPDVLDQKLRSAEVPVIGRIDSGRLWLDVRTLADDELALVAAAVSTAG